MWCVAVRTRIIYHKDSFCPFWKWKACYIPVDGRKTEGTIVRISLFPGCLRFLRRWNVRMEEKLVGYCKKLSLSRREMLLFWHMKDWTFC